MRLLCASVVVALATVSTTPAFAAAPTPRPTPTVDPRTAAQIDREVTAREQALARQRALLARAGATAAATLQAYQEAQIAADLADRRMRTEAAREVRAVRRTAQAQEAFDGFVSSLYRTGMTDPKVLLMSAALTAKTRAGFMTGIGLAERVGTEQSRAVTGLAVAADAQADAAVRARVARTVLSKAAQRAKTTKVAADRVLAEASARVARQHTELVAAQGVLAVARRRESNLAKAEVIAQAIARANAHKVPRGTCTSKDTRGYPNGWLPRSVLCPLWGTGGHVLQADAATAFNLLSRAYAAEFARPICVTDSYRSYDAQVAVKEEKPELAATPGSSNHGWGVAVDLCDGVQSFDTPTHAWLLDNAAQLGWFHPAWAEPNGAKPEAWHWEYAGTPSDQPSSSKKSP